MDIGNVIRTYRKKLGLTQAEMAKRLGVTTPAVNKWENNNTQPDIGLLAPIARLLGITTDTLLSFRESLTEEEISLYVKELDRKLDTETYEKAFAYAREKIEEYPSCAKLIWSLAIMLDSRSTVDPQNGEDSLSEEECQGTANSRNLADSRGMANSQNKTDSRSTANLQNTADSQSTANLQNTEDLQSIANLQNTTNSQNTTNLQSTTEKTDYSGQIRLWYLLALESDDYSIRKSAANSLCSLYIREKQYEKAQDCFVYFPEDDPERKRWQALLYSRMGKKKEAYKAYENLMMWSYNCLKMVLNDLRILYMKDGDHPMAHQLVEVESGLASLFRMGAYQEASVGLELAALEKDAAETERIMRILLEDYDTLMDFTRSDLYRHICTTPKPMPAFAERLKKTLAQGFVDEETFGYMRGNDFWENLRRSENKN